MAKKSKTKNPPKWTDIYPAGTQVGDEESRFFRVLARNPKYKWRSTASLAKEANLTKERTEEIILKYFHDGKNPKGMVFQSPTNEDHWGYWERVPEMLPAPNQSVSQTDKDDRIDKSLNSAVWSCLDSINDKLYQMKLEVMKNNPSGLMMWFGDNTEIKNETCSSFAQNEECVIWEEFSIDTLEC